MDFHHPTMNTLWGHGGRTKRRRKMSVYDVIYETLGHTHPGISTVKDMGEYSTPKKIIELERDSLWNLSTINPEISLETHKIFHPGNILETRTLVFEIDTVSHSLTWEKE